MSPSPRTLPRHRAAALTVPVALLAAGLSAPLAHATPDIAAASDGTAPNVQIVERSGESRVASAATKGTRYRPPLGVTFTKPPHGTPFANNYVQNLVSTINAVPCRKGESVHFMEYHSTQKAWADALIRLGTKCGVKIVGTTFKRGRGDEHYNPDWTDQFDRVRRAVGTRNGSKLVVCYYSCRNSGRTGINHEKRYNFSEAAGEKNLTILGTGNVTGDTDRAGRNGWWTTTDRKIYAASVACTATSTRDRRQPNCKPATSRDGSQRITFTQREKSYHPNLDLLNRVRCPKGKGLVLVPQWGITYDAFIEAMVRADRRGCDVRAVGNAKTWFEGDREFRVSGKRVDSMRYLAAKGVQTWDARYTRSGRRSGVYMHIKGLAMVGVQLDRDRATENVMVIGSQNETPSGLHRNDDSRIEVYSRSAALEMRQEFEVWTGNSKRIR